MDPDLTADQFIEKIMLVEEMQKFTFRKWYNNIDQEIFVYGVDDGSKMMADLLWVEDFSNWHTIGLKHRTADSSSFTKRFMSFWSRSEKNEKKFTIMNATHEKLFIEVRYADAENQISEK